MSKITALQNTVLKRYPIQSSQLEAEDKIDIAKGAVINAAILGRSDNDHWQISLDSPLKSGRIWYVFGAHFVDPTPTKESVRISFTGTPDWSNPNSKISEYFTVAEVTNRDKQRIPTKGSPEEANIIRLAKELDKVRREWALSIGVTSWYRPPSVNRAVGGVSNSQHINGGAADIYTMDGRDQEFEKFLDKHWGGGLGYGIAAGRGFTHLDLRGGGWKSGKGDIRWTY